MSIFDQISADIKKAMLARNKVELEALRGIKKELLEAKTAKGAEGELSDEKAIKIIQKMSKQSKDASALFIKQNRQDLADEYMAQVKVYDTYLPEMMSEEAITEVVKVLIEKTGATSMKEMGKVMGMASKQLAGKAEGHVISKIVKELLS